MVYFFYGDDNFSISRELKKKGSAETLSATKDLSDKDLRSRFTDLLAGQSLFATQKTVIVRNFLKLVKDYSECEQYLARVVKAPPADVTLIFAEGEDPDKRLKFFKFLQKETNATEFKIPSGKDLEAWIKNYLSDFGFEIESSALGLLMTRLGNAEQESLYDLWQVTQNLEKLMLLKDREKRIVAADIQELVRPNISQNIFALTNMFAEGKGREAMSLLEKMMAEGPAADLKSQTIQIIGGLASQIRSLLLVKDIEAESPAKIASVLGWKEGRVWINSKLAKKFTKEKLIALLKDLRALDLRLKSSEEPPKLLLSLFLQKAKA
ncbi:MAG: DNA polymerase III subunit delta [Candidatus Doudnabacteria bacterium RIFCSPHIGHO2_02_FULL_48_21]|uniref:DNA polymerase III subunit delta n=1 Tax=Candidatus Doudnabacteria bacterium RIFCSPLOWO2_02_FULL_48_13 TaxID=1817845 RepID=A0A1F5QB51_9BACT|nr:MAG: DNA polymerase III subunit delta [Candidatus Doudnabacteria bacterium RIFCSPHIGHO2_01_48_18]OGE77219.1 MAG: DNA polymerase III subunit delta [Candidatus Doudnabacteria bacterium RIFCSPHIGHO2_01_FULL_48_180]OGE91429.1 MAG: DNA polymerase III subunit delta [Candidatus Doudnabacteria bacterium RIFCSPHIGHO2_12_FULL_47_25]OGE93277.1 MAG: DNA polymerase III subunit delta [Candidatus Doudnabacteria bacterium RIFCSPHIGHO2_02_FULL_48_21]OGE96808.1 MAG: DNA polymerase III subunit delta [Candidatu